ncbi:hypothetical protein EV360DRAFT_73903 [Lentinula raphanica]|nr:hypothetical protein EV360DRAFT_73903 [Lentinula raphanica]
MLYFFLTPLLFLPESVFVFFPLGNFVELGLDIILEINSNSFSKSSSNASSSAKDAANADADAEEGLNGQVENACSSPTSSAESSSTLGTPEEVEKAEAAKFEILENQSMIGVVNEIDLSTNDRVVVVQCVFLQLYRHGPSLSSIGWFSVKGGAPAYDNRKHAESQIFKLQLQASDAEVPVPVNMIILPLPLLYLLLPPTPPRTREEVDVNDEDEDVDVDEWRFDTELDYGYGEGVWGEMERDDLELDVDEDVLDIWMNWTWIGGYRSFKRRFFVVLSFVSDEADDTAPVPSYAENDEAKSLEEDIEREETRRIIRSLFVFHAAVVDAPGMFGNDWVCSEEFEKLEDSRNGVP